MEADWEREVDTEVDVDELFVAVAEGDEEPEDVSEREGESERVRRAVGVGSCVGVGIFGGDNVLDVVSLCEDDLDRI